LSQNIPFTHIFVFNFKILDLPSNKITIKNIILTFQKIKNIYFSQFIAKNIYFAMLNHFRNNTNIVLVILKAKHEGGLNDS